MTDDSKRDDAPTGDNAAKDDASTGGDRDTTAPDVDEATDPATAGDALGELGAQAPPAWLTRRYINGHVMGTITLHYRSRDVVLGIDGEAAMRLMALIAGTGGVDLMDVIDPETSSALNGWVSVDRTDILAATWSPLPLDVVPDRVTVDPAAA